MPQKQTLFTEKIVPARPGSDRLFDIAYEPRQESIICLGIEFDDEEERRSYFLAILKEQLGELFEKLDGKEFTSVRNALDIMRTIEKWPMGDDDYLRELAQRMQDAHRQNRHKDLLQLWKDEIGFPNGEIRDILSLSDPPYYTACPNPFLENFIKFHGTSFDQNQDTYHREPFATDVSEGKNDAIYQLHPYHTKVPYRAIMHYILHYTDPGDIVFDGFCGTGMTGIAAQFCDDPEIIESLGYKIDKNGTIFRLELSERGDKSWVPFSQVGKRYAILNDLAPAASFIASNFNQGISFYTFNDSLEHFIQQLDDIEQQFWTVDMAEQEIIAYIVWSDVFICENCAQEIVFWDAAVDKETGKVATKIACPHCKATFTKRQLNRAFIKTAVDDAGVFLELPKLEPVLLGLNTKKRTIKIVPDEELRTQLFSKHLHTRFPPGFPNQLLDPGWEMYRHGMGKHKIQTHWQLYIPGSAQSLLKIWSLIQEIPEYEFRKKLLWIFTSILFRASKFNRRLPSGGGAPITGVLYIPSLIRQENVIRLFRKKLTKLLKKGLLPTDRSFAINTGSFGSMYVPKNSVDYVFIDPPFGANIFYADMNFLWESWLRVFTNRKPEAIVSDRAIGERKSLEDYGYSMFSAFKTAYRALKPGRWITVEFHNSSNAVWNVIAEALQHSGFIVSDVRTLDKQQKSFRQTTAAGAVQQDLIISAYKPTNRLEASFKLKAGTEDGVWEFIRTHLRQLPVFVLSPNGTVEVITERQDYLLYDRMVAFHVQRGINIPLSANEFYKGLTQRFPERDGMYFLPDQVAEYDRKRLSVRFVEQLPLRIMDEASAIQWLRQELSAKPQTLQELHPKFTQESAGWLKHEQPLDLAELLKQNFLMYDGEGEVPSQIHTYLSSNYKKLRKLPKSDERLKAKAKDRWYIPDPNKAADLEKLRERNLLREFDKYRASPEKHINVFRVEAIRVGFKDAWQRRDYQTIIEVAKKIPENILQEDPKLLMWYDQALTRTNSEHV